MDKVIVLVEGYAYPGMNNSYVASSTCSLVESRGKRFLVDPGTNGELLTAALNKNRIDRQSIEGIYLSHYHPDHFLGVKMFPDLDIFDGTTRWSKDKEFFYKGKIPETDIEILPTPGHSPEDASLLVKTAEGVVCIAPDVFWWEVGKQETSFEAELLDHEDPFMTDKKALVESRKLVLEKADWIIPGHGKMFRNPKK